jgi:glyoxylase-like metal-dependent hydrolase (beta-lactamase superfamily II)
VRALDILGPAPEFGVVTPLAAGVRWVRLPLPFPPGHINVYLLEGDDGEPFLVDTGFADAGTTGIWRQQPVPLRVVVTHFHPDHIGQAAHFNVAGAEVYMPAAEWTQARTLQGFDDAEVDASLSRFFICNGMHYDTAMFGRGNGYRRSVPELPRAVKTLARGTLPFTLRWRAFFVSGHSPEHALLLRAADPVLAAGDVVLPRITPNISVWPDAPEADPLGDYLDALEAMHTLPADALVLPAHGLPFRGLHERLDQLAAHHAERLQDLRDLLHGRSCTAADALPRLFPDELKPSSMLFALGETLAHLNRLWRAGEIERQCDNTGVFRYYYKG